MDMRVIMIASWINYNNVIDRSIFQPIILKKYFRNSFHTFFLFWWKLKAMFMFIKHNINNDSETRRLKF